MTELKADVLLRLTYSVFLALPQHWALITSRIRSMLLSDLTSRNWGRIQFKSYQTNRVFAILSTHMGGCSSHQLVLLSRSPIQYTLIKVLVISSKVLLYIQNEIKERVKCIPGLSQRNYNDYIIDNLAQHVLKCPALFLRVAACPPTRGYLRTLQHSNIRTMVICDLYGQCVFMFYIFFCIAVSKGLRCPCVSTICCFFKLKAQI